MTNFYIVEASRTAFGAFGGSLKHLSATDLGVNSVSKKMKDLSKHIDSCIYGNVQQTSKDAPYLARHVALRVTGDIKVPAVTVNRLCGSGIEAIIQGCYQISSKEANLVLAGGTESMSQAPFSVRGTRFGAQLGQNHVFEDTLWTALTDSLSNTPMAITAENLAEQYKISREECDEYSLSSQQRWKAAHDKGVFNSQIVPITIKSRKGEVSFSKDEHPRPETTLEALKKLKPVFKKTGVVTAAGSSGIGDGAASVLVASEESVVQLGLKPLAKILSWSNIGVEPTLMGIGPAKAIPIALKRANLSLEQMDLVEVNEAFAAQYLTIEKILKLDRAKTNTSGGAIALAHPLGASGARMVGFLSHQIAQGNAKYALASACIGGGQGVAIVLSAV